MRLILIITFLCLSSCNKKDEATPPEEKKLSTVLFSPKIGDQWTYQVTKRTLRDLNQRTNYHTDITIDKSPLTKVYLGTDPSEPSHHHFIINSENSEKEEHEYFLIDSDNIYFIAHRKKGQKKEDLPHPMLQAAREMTPGMTWGSDGNFRLIKIEQIDTAIGKKEAYKISVNLTLSSERSSYREYWFVLGLGVVNEEIYDYIKDILYSHTTITLTEYTRS